MVERTKGRFLLPICMRHKRYELIKSEFYLTYHCTYYMRTVEIHICGHMYIIIMNIYQLETYKSIHVVIWLYMWLCNVCMCIAMFSLIFTKDTQHSILMSSTNGTCAFIYLLTHHFMSSSFIYSVCSFRHILICKYMTLP